MKTIHYLIQQHRTETSALPGNTRLSKQHTHIRLSAVSMDIPVNGTLPRDERAPRLFVQFRCNNLNYV